MGIVAVFFVDHYSTVKLPGVFIAIPADVLYLFHVLQFLIFF